MIDAGSLLRDRHGLMWRVMQRAGATISVRQVDSAIRTVGHYVLGGERFRDMFPTEAHNTGKEPS